MINKIQKVLILGGGPTDIGHETELDSVIFQTIQTFQSLGIKTLLLDNNPYSVALESVQPSNMFIQAVNVDNARKIIEKEQPDAILPTVGGLLAIRVTQELLETGILGENQVRILGIPPVALQQVSNPALMQQFLNRINQPVIRSKVVQDFDEAFDVVREIGYPVIVKSVSPRGDANRKLCENESDLDDALETGFEESRVHQAVIEQSIVGNKEIEMVAIRDSSGTGVLISGIENMDPIGIHSGDSISFIPTQTLTDLEFQSLRTATLQIIQALKITGALHVQFALNSEDHSYFMTKISPYVDRSVALAAKGTGYPLATVIANLATDLKLAEIKLPDNYAKQITIMEPTVDHVLARMPIWPFQDIPEADDHLDTIMKSVGSTVGVGRSTEEAILKSLRSSQLSPKDLLPKIQLSDNQLIDQLIHPRSNRIYVLFEALRRNYQVDELSELTKIDPFYFYKLKHIIELEAEIQDHPMDVSVLERAKYFGFGDGMVAGIWHMPFDDLRQLERDNHILPTYKSIEPTAGEFEKLSTIFYSTFEIENESQKLPEKSALVVGRGGNQLGPNSAADYFTVTLLNQLRKLNYQTIIMNINPNATSLTPQLSDKQYIEPIQLGEVLNIIELEKPEIIFIPGNRHYLTRELKKRHQKIVILPPDQALGVELAERANLSVSLFVTDKQAVPIELTRLVSQDHSNQLDRVAGFKTPPTLKSEEQQVLIDKAMKEANSRDLRGIVQVLFLQTESEIELTGIRPVRLTELAFLNKVTGINWIRILAQQKLGLLDEDILTEFKVNLKPDRVAVMSFTYPFEQLRINQVSGTSQQQIGGEIAFGSTIENARSELTNDI
ncbi:Carbamoylphosphate synthase large subunit [Secundilactobacillus oryzae JCM 18671]|uniref:Carbamoylphosphate synthase large subunit n=1 Tax=Secundilactobacillus oryzae JCM 18671 TaxID=1291743 RepID=A0A081BIJ4_9LACO|nr:ATP-grasp domain-containing protein [Secundilactobacillus oryzae]GAK47862.1 Carbamoylphosphate synthase large subunit [Secundilactobacillus oryzae JCM 18671]